MKRRKDLIAAVEALLEYAAALARVEGTLADLHPEDRDRAVAARRALAFTLSDEALLIELGERFRRRVADDVKRIRLVRATSDLLPKLPRRMPSTPGAEATLAASLVEACRRWEIPLEKNRSAAMVSRIFEKSGESRQARVAMIIAEQAYPELALKGRTLNGLFSVVRGSSPKQGHLAVEDLEAIYSDECNTRDMGLLALSFVFPGATKEEIEQAFDAARHVFDSTATLQANRVSLQRHHEQNALHRDHERDTRKSAKRHGTRRPQKR